MRIELVPSAKPASAFVILADGTEPGFVGANFEGSFRELSVPFIFTPEIALGHGHLEWSCKMGTETDTSNVAPKVKDTVSAHEMYILRALDCLEDNLLEANLGEADGHDDHHDLPKGRDAKKPHQQILDKLLAEVSSGSDEDDASSDEGESLSDSEAGGKFGKKQKKFVDSHTHTEKSAHRKRRPFHFTVREQRTVLEVRRRKIGQI